MSGPRKRILFVLLLFIVHHMYISSIQGAEKAETLIEIYNVDIDGDGLPEKISLHGQLLHEYSSYFQNVWLDISDSFSMRHKIVLLNGYAPALSFIDLTQDGNNDLFYESAVDPDYKKRTYQLYHFKNGVPTKVKLPTRNYINIILQDEFKIAFRLSPTDDWTVKKIDPYHQVVNRHNIYNEKGSLITEQNLTVQTVHLMKPILIHQKKGYGLKTYEYITTNLNETIGQLETIWYYKEGKWLNLKTNIILSS